MLGIIPAFCLVCRSAFQSSCDVVTVEMQQVLSEVDHMDEGNKEEVEEVLVQFAFTKCRNKCDQHLCRDLEAQVHKLQQSGLLRAESKEDVESLFEVGL